MIKLLPMLLLTLIPVSDWHSEYKVMRVTAYCAGPCSVCQTTGVTSTGRSAYTDGVAVDPTEIRHGSRLDIPGYGNWVKADDIGGAITTGKLDVRCQTHSEAKAFGTKYLRVRIWRK